MNQGAPTDQALAILDRLNRLEQGASSSAPPKSRTRNLPAVEGPWGSRAAWAVLTFLIAVILASGAFGAGAFRSDWRALLDRRPPSQIAPIARPAGDAGPSLPRRGEMALARARALHATGRLRDALSVLDGVRPTDAQKSDADRLKADIQRQLIELDRSTP